jgi:hypothetical protein
MWAAESRAHITKTIHVFASEVKVQLWPPPCEKCERSEPNSPAETLAILKLTTAPESASKRLIAVRPHSAETLSRKALQAISVCCALWRIMGNSAWTRYGRATSKIFGRMS